MLRHSGKSRPIYFTLQFILLGKVEKSILDTGSNVCPLHPLFCFPKFVNQPFDLLIKGHMELMCGFCKFLYGFNQLCIDWDCGTNGAQPANLGQHAGVS